MERTQTVKIQKWVNQSKEGKPTSFNGTLEAVKAHIFTLQIDALPPGKKRRPITTENRDKDKKLGLGIHICVSDEKLPIMHTTFWPVKLEKPKHIK